MTRPKSNKNLAAAEPIRLECWKCGKWFAIQLHACPNCKETNEEAKTWAAATHFSIRPTEKDVDGLEPAPKEIGE